MFIDDPLLPMLIPGILIALLFMSILASDLAPLEIS
jgi:hypothetical protein